VEVNNAYPGLFAVFAIKIPDGRPSPQFLTMIAIDPSASWKYHGQVIFGGCYAAVTMVHIH
jgi:hypothetical protein